MVLARIAAKATADFLLKIMGWDGLGFWFLRFIAFLS